ncbi:MAG: DivIVA domain-containing protein [Actinomycetota bacterium]
MSITPRELRDLEIKESLRGYNRDEVNDLLERASATIEENERRIAELAERLANAESAAGRSRETEDVLNRTLLLAQRAADEALEEATREARRLIDDAEARAARIVADAEHDARERAAVEHERLEAETAVLASRRDEAAAESARLESFAAERRAALVAGLEADLATIRTGGEVSAPIGAIADGPLAAAPAAAGVAPEPTRPEPVPPTIVPVAPVAAAAAAPATPAVEEPSEALLVEDTDAGPATGEVDMQSLFGDVVGPEETSGSTPPEATIEETATALFGEVGSAEVLDDDAFFATLREAVDDDAPLGPREDDDQGAALFDQDAKETGFRDVFRRRR